MWSETYLPVLSQVAALIQANPSALQALIQVESSWNPSAYNPSGAVGLIQFMPRTLQGMGLLSPALAAQIPVDSKAQIPDSVKLAIKSEFLLKYPDVRTQLLGPVLTYLRKGSPYPTEQSLFMQVFFPIARDVPADTTFAALYNQHYGASGPALYAIFAAQNPGIDTVQDYVDRVKKKPKISGTSLSAWLRKMLSRLRP